MKPLMVMIGGNSASMIHINRSKVRGSSPHAHGDISIQYLMLPLLVCHIGPSSSSIWILRFMNVLHDNK